LIIFLLIKDTLFLGWESLGFFATRGQTLFGAAAGVRTTDPQFPSLMPWKSATATPWLELWIFNVLNQKIPLNIWDLGQTCGLIP